MANPDLAKLESIARDGRVQILRMLTHSGSGHPGGSLSVIDILTVLYFSRMKYDAKNPTWRAPASSRRASCSPSASWVAPSRAIPIA
jgi:transketolase N-terminal domain/subunit